MSDVLVFDVNETLLNVRALAPRFEAVLGDAALLPQWFGQMLRNSLVATVTRTYAPFDVQGVDALRLTARRAGVDLSKPDAVTLVEAIAELPPHPDVIPALERFRAAGVRMATLTNSAPRIVEAQLPNAGLTEYVERSLSVESVALFKPAPEVYRYAASELGIDIGAMRLVAAHDWDVTGAIRAGAKAAFVARPGAFLGELSERPDVIGPDLGSVADQLLVEN
jgi:2-haloacid dehalogenase